MRAYIAGSYRDREQLRSVAEELQKYGIIVVSSWLWESSGDFAEEAVRDLFDLAKADTLILFTETPLHRGGREVEYGVAIGLNLHLIIMGPRTNVFHHHPSVLAQFESFDGRALQYLIDCHTRGF